ncbi:MAG TPA: hypothetical protein VGI20_09290 [Rhizomicrobium sp.]|jgi:hypothetical protein
MGRKLAAGLLSLAALAAGNDALAAKRCARPDEVTAIQAAAIQQELMVAALTCNEVSRFNAFQTNFGPELRTSDAALERMFKRLYGGARGEAQYHAFKTRLANHSSMRSIKSNVDYCSEASQVFGAALASEKPTLVAFVAGVPVFEETPVSSCQMRVAVGLAGAEALPDITPRPNPDRR